MFQSLCGTRANVRVIPHPHHFRHLSRLHNRLQSQLVVCVHQCMNLNVASMEKHIATVVSAFALTVSSDS